MSESTQGIVVLIFTSVVVSFFVHALVRSFVAACFISAAIALVVFQFFAYLHIGYLDPFFVIALFTGGVAAYIVALFVGLPFLLYRRKQNGKT
ncbi:MAG: hypothetical protein HY279_12980 [Nitrospinae bacterium]|nr:hypothetical protein [Nitrospinota bacterium]